MIQAIGLRVICRIALEPIIHAKKRDAGLCLKFLHKQWFFFGSARYLLWGRATP
jgi:hypothetical protein